MLLIAFRDHFDMFVPGVIAGALSSRGEAVSCVLN